MSEASWAAAGMLSAHDPEHPPQLRALAELSIRLYPQFLRTIEDLSGRSVPCRTSGALVSGEANGSGSQLSPEEARRRVPQVTTEGRSFFWMEEISLDPRDLCAALPAAAVAAGIKLEEDTEIVSVRCEDGFVEVTTRSGVVRAGAFVNCCGAWSGQVGLLGAEVKERAAVGPWKGQIFKVAVDPAVDLPCVLRTPEVYLVPRGGGAIVVGATVEQAGFDRKVNPAVVERLLKEAAAVWPPIASGRVTETWAGLRPGTSDGLPVIGGQKRCWIASGHFRNGVLLAPATGVVVRELMEGMSPSVSLEAFRPER
jgi:glycine oxidase